MPHFKDLADFRGDSEDSSEIINKALASLSEYASSAKDRSSDDTRQVNLNDVYAAASMKATAVAIKTQNRSGPNQLLGTSEDSMASSVLKTVKNPCLQNNGPIRSAGEGSELSHLDGSMQNSRQGIMLSDLMSERSNSTGYKSLLLSLPTFKFSLGADGPDPENGELRADNLKCFICL